MILLAQLLPLGRRGGGTQEALQGSIPAPEEGAAAGVVGHKDQAAERRPDGALSRGPARPSPRVGSHSPAASKQVACLPDVYVARGIPSARIPSLSTARVPQPPIDRWLHEGPNIRTYVGEAGL